jgi:hypothetical protein
LSSNITNPFSLLFAKGLKSALISKKNSPFQIGFKYSLRPGSTKLVGKIIKGRTLILFSFKYVSTSLSEKSFLLNVADFKPGTVSSLEIKSLVLHVVHLASSYTFTSNQAT